MLTSVVFVEDGGLGVDYVCTTGHDFNLLKVDSTGAQSDDGRRY